MPKIDAAIDAINQGIAEMFADEPELARALGFTRQPSYRYYEFMGRQYCWTTERMSDGKFRAFEYRPFGKGSRTPKKASYHAQVKSTQWKLVREVKCATRKRAKLLAKKWHDAYAKEYWDKHTDASGKEG